jgi:hypothetical protein
MGPAKSSDDGFSDFADFKSAAANGEFNPRAGTVAGKVHVCVCVKISYFMFVVDNRILMVT